MDNKKLHPVDDYFLAKVNEGDKNVTYNQANWEQLSARLDKHSLNPKPTGKTNFFAKNIYIISVFFTALIFLSVAIYLLDGSQDVLDSTTIIKPSTFEKIIIEDVSVPLESDLIIVSGNEVRPKNESSINHHREKISPIPSLPSGPVEVLENVDVVLDNTVKKQPSEAKIFDNNSSIKPGEPIKTVQFSLPQVTDHTEIQIESPKDSLFIFW